jgi:glycosyltransferase involved in cell wall biosynthesis
MVVHGPYPLGEERVAREAHAALDAGWEVDVVAMREPNEPTKEAVDGVTVFRLPLRHTWGAGFWAVGSEYLGFTLRATAKVATLAARRRYAVIHVHNPPDFLILASFAPRLLGAQVVFDIHDFAPELFAMRFEESRALPVARRTLRLIEGTAVRFSNAVVTVSDPDRRALEARGAPREKIAVIMNSLDERVLPSAGEPGQESGAERAQETRFRVVYHGTITPPHGVPLLVEAAARAAREIPSLRLEIYGDGDALAEVTSRAERLGLSDLLYLSGRFLPHREVLERVRAASAGVVPNLPVELNETVIPTKLFEYALLGIPVVSADLPAIREYFSPDEVLFFRAGDVNALAEGLREVASDPETARVRAAAARRRYEEYRWPVNARRYVELLERLSPAPDQR